jgi:hypothetical protein
VLPPLTFFLAPPWARRRGSPAGMRCSSSTAAGPGGAAARGGGGVTRGRGSSPAGPRRSHARLGQLLRWAAAHPCAGRRSSHARRRTPAWTGGAAKREGTDGGGRGRGGGASSRWSGGGPLCSSPHAGHDGAHDLSWASALLCAAMFLISRPTNRDLTRLIAICFVAINCLSVVLCHD